MLVNVVVLGTIQLLVPALITGQPPHQSLLVGPFGSSLFADIALFSVSPTDAPNSAVAAFFVLLAGVWRIVTVIPGFTVAVRRLHDSNLSGWWALLAFVPLGSFALLLLAVRRSRFEGARFDR